ncbi:hypothetical protein [Parasphingorhabdus pacifica]
MPSDPLIPSEAARWAARAGLPPDTARLSGLAATADHVHSVVSTLRELDFAETPPAFAYRSGEEQTFASL